MEFPEITNWRLNETTINSLLFVQRISELSFDYTSYLHKANRQTTRSLSNEIIHLVNNFKKSKHDSFFKEFEHLKKELNHRIRYDEIARSLIGNKKDQYLSSLNNPDDLDNVINCMELMSNKVSIENYLFKCIDQLKICLHYPKEKKRVLRLTENFFESCIDAGYQQGTIYHLTKKYFFGKTPINNPTDLDGYFDYFDLNTNKYSVIFKGPKDFELVKDSFEAFDIEIIKDVTSILKQNDFYKFCLNRNGKFIYIKCKNVIALDYLAARNIAENRLRKISNIIGLFSHKKNLRWEFHAIVYHEEKDNPVEIKAPNNPIVNISDSRLHIANKKFITLTEHLNLKKESFERFDRALSFHSLAGKIEDPSNQLVNLWTCLEILLIGSKTGSKIEQIERDLTNFVKDAYIPYLLSQVTCELREWDDKKTSDLAKKTHTFQQGNQDLEYSLAELIALKEHETIVSEFMAKMDNAPYLRMKLMFLIENLQKTKRIKLLLNAIKNRIIWDIRRLYRTRNLIVHLGHTPKNINNQVEIAHTFLDILFSVIYQDNIFLGTISTIENAIIDYRLKRERHNELLKLDQECNKNNFIYLLYCDN